MTKNSFWPLFGPVHRALRVGAEGEPPDNIILGPGTPLDDHGPFLILLGKECIALIVGRDRNRAANTIPGAVTWRSRVSLNSSGGAGAPGSGFGASAPVSNEMKSSPSTGRSRIGLLIFPCHWLPSAVFVRIPETFYRLHSAQRVRRGGVQKDDILALALRSPDESGRSRVPRVLNNIFPASRRADYSFGCRAQHLPIIRAEIPSAGSPPPRRAPGRGNVVAQRKVSPEQASTRICKR